MSLLDLLGAIVNPELSATERMQLRSLLRQHQHTEEDRPWPSGLIEEPRQKSETEVLRERVEDLELALKVLCDLLAEHGLLSRTAVPDRIAYVQRQLAAEEDAKQAQMEAARRAAEARTVTCSQCSAVIRERDSFLSAQGPLCSSCHLAQEE